MTRAEIDKGFLMRCLAAADQFKGWKRTKYKLEAYACYALVTSIGAVVWRIPFVIDDTPRCGIKPFCLPEAHPFKEACAWHDEQYNAHKAKKSAKRAVKRSPLP